MGRWISGRQRLPGTNWNRVFPFQAKTPFRGLEEHDQDRLLSCFSSLMARSVLSVSLSCLSFLQAGEQPETITFLPPSHGSSSHHPGDRNPTRCPSHVDGMIESIGHLTWFVVRLQVCSRRIAVGTETEQGNERLVYRISCLRFRAAPSTPSFPLPPPIFQTSESFNTMEARQGQLPVVMLRMVQEQRRLENDVFRVPRSPGAPPQGRCPK
jgi:hypothetical protein